MPAARRGRPFLGVRFIRCSAYGRLYLNRDGTAYVGRCPRCGEPYRIAVGPDGTTHRFFVAACR